MMITPHYPSLTSWNRVFILCAAIIATTFHALSFALDKELGPTAQAVGIAAGVSWPLFILLLFAIRGVSPLTWIDIALEAMSYGLAPLIVGGALNVMMQGLLTGVQEQLILPLHGAILFFSDALMGTVFVRLAADAGVSKPLGVALWVGGLNGLFVALMALLG